MIIIDIPFEPKSWIAPQFSRGRCYDKLDREKRCIRYCIKEQYKGEIIDDFVILLFHFVFKPPKSATKKQRAKMLAQEIFPTKRDCTNMQKLYEDCLKGIVIKDDRTVSSVASLKYYDEKECIKIRICSIPNSKIK